MRRTIALYSAILVFLPVLPKPTLAAGAPDLMAVVRVSHRAARDSIHTCAAQVEVLEQVFGQNARTSRAVVDYRRTIDQVCVRAVSGDGRQQVVYKDGALHAVTTDKTASGQPKMGAVISPVPHYPRLSGDAWSLGLMVVPVPNTISFTTLEELLDTSASIRSVQHHKEGQKALVEINLTYDRKHRASELWHLTIRLDPQSNYLVQRVIMTCTPKADRKEVRRDYEVLRFKEVAPGVYFPEHVAHRISIDGTERQVNEIKITNLRVNTPLPADSFRLAYARGVRVIDRVKGAEYLVDVDGTPITPVSPRPKSFLPPPRQVDQQKGRATSELAETKEEPGIATWWILPLSFAFLGVAAVVALTRSRRTIH
jgi:hypothetical protein